MLRLDWLYLRHTRSSSFFLMHVYKYMCYRLLTNTCFALIHSKPSRLYLQRVSLNLRPTYRRYNGCPVGGWWKLRRSNLRSIFSCKTRLLPAYVLYSYWVWGRWLSSTKATRDNLPLADNQQLISIVDSLHGTEPWSIRFDIRKHRR